MPTYKPKPKKFSARCVERKQRRRKEGKVGRNIYKRRSVELASYELLVAYHSICGYNYEMHNGSTQDALTLEGAVRVKGGV